MDLPNKATRPGPSSFSLALDACTTSRATILSMFVSTAFNIKRYGQLMQMSDRRLKLSHSYYVQESIPSASAE